MGVFFLTWNNTGEKTRKGMILQKCKMVRNSGYVAINMIGTCWNSWHIFCWPYVNQCQSWSIDFPTPLMEQWCTCKIPTWCNSFVAPHGKWLIQWAADILWAPTASDCLEPQLLIHSQCSCIFHTSKDKGQDTDSFRWSLYIIVHPSICIWLCLRIGYL
jgi:hypothetical protein